QLLTNWRFERVGTGLDLVGGCTQSVCSQRTYDPYYMDIRSWKLGSTGFSPLQNRDTAPAVGLGVGLWKRSWAGSWWELSFFGTIALLNGTNLPQSVADNYPDLSFQAAE